MTKLQLCKTLEVDCDLCYIYVVTLFNGPTKATKTGVRASEIGLRAIFHFGNGSVAFDHTLLAIGWHPGGRWLLSWFPLGY